MGFGFNLGMIFIIIPVSILLFILGVITKKKIFSIIFFSIWTVIIASVVLTSIIQFLMPDNKLDKDDYYGEYIIDREFFSGKESDWQYNRYRMEIKESDSIFLYTYDKEKLVATHKGGITTVQPYGSERLVIHMEKPNHHITNTNPTVYREGWGSFYLVFYSTKFHNMYFRKGNWKRMD